MIERIAFWLRCFNHWDREGHWPERPRLYDDFFLCMRCNKGSGRGIRALTYRKAVGAFGYG